MGSQVRLTQWFPTPGDLGEGGRGEDEHDPAEPWREERALRQVVDEHGERRYDEILHADFLAENYFPYASRQDEKDLNDGRDQPHDSEVEQDVEPAVVGIGGLPADGCPDLKDIKTGTTSLKRYSLPL